MQKMEKQVLIIGGASYDVTCRVNADIVAHDSNPGVIYGSGGGVGRNIAENCARMGLSTSFISALGEDSFSDAIRKSCESCGIDMSHCMTVPQGRSCVYVSILDKRGELELGSSDFSTLEKLDKDRISAETQFIGKHEIVFIDANFSEDVLQETAAHVKGRLFAETVSVPKAIRLLPVLSSIHTLKTNRAELREVSGIDTDTIEGTREACQWVIGRGTKRVVVTMGVTGSFCMEGDKFCSFPAFPAEVINVTGAGDAFAAGLVFATLNGYSNEEMLRIGTAASHIALRSATAVNPEMSETELFRYIKKINA